MVLIFLNRICKSTETNIEKSRKRLSLFFPPFLKYYFILIYNNNDLEDLACVHVVFV